MKKDGWDINRMREREGEAACEEFAVSCANAALEKAQDVAEFWHLVQAGKALGKGFELPEDAADKAVKEVEMVLKSPVFEDFRMALTSFIRSLDENGILSWVVGGISAAMPEGYTHRLEFVLRAFRSELELFAEDKTSLQGRHGTSAMMAAEQYLREKEKVMSTILRDIFNMI